MTATGPGRARWTRWAGAASGVGEQKAHGTLGAALAALRDLAGSTAGSGVATGFGIWPAMAPGGRPLPAAVQARSYSPAQRTPAQREPPEAAIQRQPADPKVRLSYQRQTTDFAKLAISARDICPETGRARLRYDRRNAIEPPPARLTRARTASTCRKPSSPQGKHARLDRVTRLLTVPQVAHGGCHAQARRRGSRQGCPAARHPRCIPSVVASFPLTDSE